MEAAVATGLAPEAKVFISYSRSDAEDLVDRLKTALAQRRVQAFVDRHDIPKNDVWRRALNEAIDGAHAFLFIISRHSVTSEFCAEELKRAETFNKPLIAARAETIDDATIPESLRARQYIDFRNPATFAVNVDEVDRAIRTDFSWRRRAAEFLVEAERWREREKPARLLLRPQRVREAEQWLTQRPALMDEPEGVREFIALSRKAANRQRRALIVGSVATGALALGVAVWMLFAYQARENERRRADSNFGAATDLTNNVIREIFPELRKRRGIDQSTILRVLTASEKMIGELVSGLDNTPRVQELRMYVDNEFQQTYWFLGNIDKGKRYVDEALDLNAGLLSAVKRGADRASRDNTVALLKLRSSLKSDLANELHVVGRIDDFVAALVAAKETEEQVIALTSADRLDERIDLSLALGRIGDAYRKAGRFADAAKEYARSEELQRQVLAAKPPDDRKARDALSWSDNRAGDNALQIVQHEGFLPLDSALKPRFAATAEGRIALDRYRDAYEIRKSLLDDDPTLKERRANFIWSAALYGMAEIAFDDAAATQTLEDAEKTARLMAESEADDTQTKRYLALIQMFLGDAYIVRGDLRSAFANYEQSQKLREGLTIADKPNARWRMDLLYLYEHLSTIYDDLGNVAKSQDYAQKGVALAPDVLKAFPGDDNLAATASLLTSHARRRP